MPVLGSLRETSRARASTSSSVRLPRRPPLGGRLLSRRFPRGSRLPCPQIHSFDACAHKLRCLHNKTGIARLLAKLIGQRIFAAAPRYAEGRQRFEAKNQVLQEGHAEGVVDDADTAARLEHAQAFCEGPGCIQCGDHVGHQHRIEPIGWKAGGLALGFLKRDVPLPGQLAAGDCKHLFAEIGGRDVSRGLDEDSGLLTGAASQLKNVTRRALGQQLLLQGRVGGPSDDIAGLFVIALGPAAQWRTQGLSPDGAVPPLVPSFVCGIGIPPVHHERGAATSVDPTTDAFPGPPRCRSFLRLLAHSLGPWP
jgi:hypothetical protein